MDARCGMSPTVAAVEESGNSRREIACVRVEPGVCGFDCVIRARRVDRRTVEVEILGSGCKQIQRLSSQLKSLSLQELFIPIPRNPVCLAAAGAGCHASCVIPVAVLKAAEVVLGMAVARDAHLTFTFQET